MAYNDVTETKQIVTGCELDCDGCGLPGPVAERQGERVPAPKEWAVLRPPGDENPYHMQHFCPDCAQALEAVIVELAKVRTGMREGAAAQQTQQAQQPQAQG